MFHADFEDPMLMGLGLLQLDQEHTQSRFVTTRDCVRSDLWREKEQVAQVLYSQTFFLSSRYQTYRRAQFQLKALSLGYNRFILLY